MAPDDVPAPRARLLLLALLALAFAVRAVELDDSWSDQGFKSAFGAFASGAHARGLYEHGFLESSFLPYYWRVELEDGTLVRNWYTHHPPFYALLTAASMRVFGAGEWALRLPWTLIGVLAIVPLYRLLALVWSRRTALVAATLFAFVPYASWWGTMVWCDFVVMALYAWTLRHYVLWLREDRTASLMWVAAGILLGGFVDWTAYFILPGLGLHAAHVAWRRRGARGWAPLTVWLVAFVAPLAVHALHIRAVVGEEQASRDTSSTLAWVTTFPAMSFAEFCRLQVSFVWRYLTAPVTLLAGAGVLGLVVLAARRRLQAERWVALLLLPPGLIYAFAFPARSWNHDFFGYLSTPGLVTAAALALEVVRRRTPRWVAPAALAICCGAGLWEHADLYRQERSGKVRALAEHPEMAPVLADANTLILACNGLGNLLLVHTSAPLIHEVNLVQQLEAHRLGLLARRPDGARTVFLLDIGTNRDNPHGELLRPLVEYLDLEASSMRELADPDHGLELRLYDLTDWARR